MDPTPNEGDSQMLHHQQQSSQQQPQFQQQRQRQERDQEYWRQQNLQQYHQQLANAASVGAGMSVSTPNSGSSRMNSKPPLPARSSTVGSPNELERRNGKSANDSYIHPQHARSEDLNHGSGVVSTNGMNTYPPSSSQGSPTQGYLSLSRPMTPADVVMFNGASSSSNHSDAGGGGIGDDARTRRLSTSSNPAGSASKPSSSTLQAPIQSTICAACHQQLEGAFVRALGNVWHLQCFKCKDCDAVVASKFFPIETPEGKQQPLCERDYFRRLNLICAKCGQALRASYITACNKKYHVEHFTCSVCPTVFGPQDSYYEHENDVYCHFHYSTRFATKCAGCNSAILKQFVEINRNNRDECWHPECYMINKFWNVKVSSRRPTSPSTSSMDVAEPAWIEEEERETAQSLKSKQVRMEQQVYRIWTVLSAFEESSAACISDMLRFVSNGQYLDAVRMAEKFILHVEVLFATIDDLEVQFLRLNLKSLAHVREARLLCRKTVDLFTLLSRPQDSSQRRTGITQELLALVTGLAHYLKILIRIALTGGLKLERDHTHREAMEGFLDKLHLLVVEGGNPSARRVIRGGEKTTGGHVGAPGTQGVTYGFKSLAPEHAGESPFGAENGSTELTERLSVSPPTDQCVRCLTTVEEDCARYGTYHRWHSNCLQCSTCGVAAGPPVVKEQPAPTSVKSPGGDDKETPSKVSVPRRPPANVDNYVCDLSSAKDSPYGPVPQAIYCLDHHRPGCHGGFQAASRLEQYAFLLNIALRRLSYVLKKRGLLLPSQVTSTLQAYDAPERDPYRDSGELTRMKTAHLDRKVSATATARLPRRSTIVESPSGRTAQTTDIAHSQRAVSSSAAQERALQQQQAIAGTPTRPLRPAGNLLAITQPQSTSAPPQQQQQLQQMSQNVQQQPQQQSSQPARPRVNTPGPLPTNVDDKGQMFRPPFARANTGVMIVDDSAPNSPAGGVDDHQLGPVDDGITLADIPQVLAAEEARQRHRSLPSHIPHIAELTPMELMIVKHAALLALYRSPLKGEFDLDDLLEFVEVKKSGFWNKLFNKGGKQKKGIFGVPLEMLVEREGADSVLGASRATLRVPSFIDDVISAMRQMDMSVEGIFRKNGNIRRLNELIEAIDRDPSSVDLTQDNAVQLAALLKKFLKALPEPLMTYKLYRLFMAAENHTNEVEKKRLLHFVTLLLPKGNRDTVEVLFVFLKWVASFAHVDEETGNRMDLHNLATVISPNIFRSYASKGNDNVRVESFEGIRVCDTLLIYQDEFYLVPEEFLPMIRDQDFFANCADLPSKEFLKRCDQYLRQKPGGRVPPHPGLTSPVIGSASFNTSTSMSSMAARDGNEGGRLASQRSDPAMSSRGRQLMEANASANAGGGGGGRGGNTNINGYDARMYPSAPQSLERASTPQDNTYLRNGNLPPPPPRQQSPPPRLPHQPFSHPPMGQSSSGSYQQGMAGMAGVGMGVGMGVGVGSIPRSASPLTQQDAEWAAAANQQQPQPPQLPASMSSSSSSYTPRSSGEHSHHNNFGPPNGHAPVQVRQRT